MGTVIRSIFFLLALWLTFFTGLQVIGIFFPEHQTAANNAAVALGTFSASFGNFLGPVLQLAIVVAILLHAAEKIGVLKQDATTSLFSKIAAANNVQAFIAIVIIVSLSIATLGGIGDVPVLKDLALVVVGFYFGTKRQVEPGHLTGPSSASIGEAPPDSRSPNSNI
ncbi:hypothetical protein [Pseudomonas tohonis]|uniref:hypothetical protein n=1 Tax=Pseudomonas tohonis TaxID=2725477 RepID=UPI001F1D03EA|nr:hypothetical protein [Pseudomonas tohonis]